MWEDINTNPLAVVSTLGEDTRKKSRSTEGQSAAEQVAFHTRGYCGVMLLKRLGPLCSGAEAKQQKQLKPGV